MREGACEGSNGNGLSLPRGDTTNDPDEDWLAERWPLSSVGTMGFSR
jgi:hypothetical protein